MSSRSTSSSTSRSTSSTTGSPTTSSSSSSSSSFTTHTSFSSLMNEFDYDAFILDQFGVMHNGKHALEGAIDCVEQLAKRHKKKLIILSNTSSPAKTTLTRLHKNLGFDRTNFIDGVGAITSGEEAARYIRETYGGEEGKGDEDEDESNDNSNKNKKKKSKFIWFTWDPNNENVPNPLDFLEQCGPNIEPTVNVEEADFIVAHGSGVIRGNGGGDDTTSIVSMGNFLNDGSTAGKIDELLQDCANRNLPLICANPDMIVKYHDGSIKHMPGKIANRYIERFQKKDITTIFGKPHREHFEACLRELQEQHQREQQQQQEQEEALSSSSSSSLPSSPPRPLRVAHVGDSIHHDVAGANAAGIPSIFVVGGIHSEELLASSSSENDGDGDGDGDGDVNGDGNDNNKSDDRERIPTRTKLPSEKTLQEFFDKEGHTPTHVVPMFRL